MDIANIIFDELPDFFVSFVDTIGKFFGWLTYSLSDAVDMLREWVDIDSIDAVINFIEKLIKDQIPFNLFWDVPIIAIMFGGTLLFYVIFQLATWILNIIT